MNERFEAYFEELERLSSDDLDRSAAKLVLVEKRSAARLIAHLSEISRRKEELERGYSSLFEYCVRRLNLSEGSVALRIQVANVALRFPRILEALAEGKISLSVAGRLAPHLSEENVEKLIEDCTGMTRREAAGAIENPCPDEVPQPGQPSAPAMETDPETEPAPGPANSRAVPAAVRERVLERAGYRCEYRGPGGRRCSSRTGLEIEHLKPFAIFRSHDERHLRAFCYRHNRLSAEQTYGAGFIRDKIEARRSAGKVGAVLQPSGGT